MDLKEEAILGPAIASHWYYVSKGRAVRSLLGDFKSSEVLDVGAGSGIFSRQLIDEGFCERATCVDPGYEKDHTESYGRGTLPYVRSIKESSATLVLMMDVLEHVDDDVGLLRKYTQALPRNGKVLITVPAFQFLWSGHDDFLEHRRRYTRKMVEKMVADAGLAVERCRYFYGLLFPLVAAMRIAQRRQSSAMHKHARPVNSALTWFHDVERRVLFPYNIFAGLTVFCLARPR